MKMHDVTQWLRERWHLPFLALLFMAFATNIYVFSPSPELFIQTTSTVSNAVIADDNDDSGDTLFIHRSSYPDLEDYECVGWRSTQGCSPQGERDPRKDKGCNAKIEAGTSGYCEFRHKIRKDKSISLMHLHCDSLRAGVKFQCDQVPQFLNYGKRAIQNTHDDKFSYTVNRINLQKQNQMQQLRGIQLDFSRGVVMVVYKGGLLSAYASIKSMRALGMALPIELWYKRSEINLRHPLIQALLPYNVYMREIKDDRATSFYTKLYAVFYSAFDKVLLLDADNFAVRDPTYLFDTHEFNSTGAVFWPDYWRPARSLFAVHERSALWQIYDLPFVDMFEQESGQVLIDRRRHEQAMNVLMYYGFTMPRIHEDLRLVWGDKDLFRLAWLKTGSRFHMISRPPDSAGRVNKDTNKFCGLSMVQRDPSGEIVFIHRSNTKFSKDKVSRMPMWTHIQEFQVSRPLDDYIIQRAKVFPDYVRCFGHTDAKSEAFLPRPIQEFPFRDIEAQLLRFVEEALAIGA